MSKNQSIVIANTSIFKSNYSISKNCSWSIRQIFHFRIKIPYPLNSRFASTKFAKFLAKRLLTFLFRSSFLIPKCSALMLWFDNNLIFFSLQKLFNRKFVSACVVSIFLLYFRKLLSVVLGEGLMALLTIFLRFIVSLNHL